MANPRLKRSLSASDLNQFEFETDFSGSLLSYQGLFSSPRASVNLLADKKLKTISISNPNIPKLPVLDALYANLQQGSNSVQFGDYVFVCGQHLLDTTASLIQWLIKVGAQPSNIFIVGKSYSNNEEVITWLKEMGVQLVSNSEQVRLGEFADSYNNDVNTLWTKVYGHLKSLKSKIDGLVVIDDGGHVLKGLPKKVKKFCNNLIVGIEQTSSGVSSAQRTQFSTIQLASSAIKSLIEPPMIADRVAEKLSHKIAQVQQGGIGEKAFHEAKSSAAARAQIIDYYKTMNNSSLWYGIIGYGHIGKAILQRLIKDGAKHFIISDSDPSKERDLAIIKQQNPDVQIGFVNDVSTLISSASIIIGCTGKDSIKTLDPVSFSTHPKILISCSSKDSEFLSLLKKIQDDARDVEFDPLADIGFKNGFDKPLLVVKGGMPVNFDNSLESVPAHDIQVIRGLKAQAILQAYYMLKEWKSLGGAPAAKTYQLSPQMQLDVFNEWIKDPQASPQYYEKHKDTLTEKYIAELSVGEKYSFEPSYGSCAASSCRM